MIILITGTFKVYDLKGYWTGEWENVVDYGVDSETLQPVVLPNIHPSLLGATIDQALGEWVIP